MKILVCISATPDTTSKISFNSEGNEFNSAGVTYIMNPYDEWYALVRALELKEAANEGLVTLIHVGPAENEQIIRKGLAIGGDEAVRVDAKPKSALFVAKQIAEYAKSENFDIIFTGKETIDYNGSEIGAMVAEFLGVPFVSYGSKLELSGQNASVTRDIEGGVELVSLQVPFVVSAAKGMAEQRIPNMRGIMMAKTKPLKIVSPVPFNDPVVAVKYQLPGEKTGVKLVAPENMEELVRLLHEEAKVI